MLTKLLQYLTTASHILLYGKTFILLITSFSQYTTICFVSFVIRFSMNILNFSLSRSENFICVADFILTCQDFTFAKQKFHRNPLDCLVGPSGLEPPTSCLSGTRSNLLSYEPMWLVSDLCHLVLLFPFSYL